MTESFFRDHSEHPDQPARDSAEMPQPTAPAAADDGELQSDESRLAAIMSYIPFLCFVPLVNINWRENEEARFHARQGIVLFLIEIVAVVLLVDDLAKFVFKAVLVGAGALAAAGIYFALQGKRIRLPIISNIADKAKL